MILRDHLLLGSALTLLVITHARGSANGEVTSPPTETMAAAGNKAFQANVSEQTKNNAISAAQDGVVKTRAVNAQTLRVAPTKAVYGPQNDRPVYRRPAAIPVELDQGVRQALKAYPTVRAAEFAIEASDSDVRAAKRRRLPSASLEALSFAGGNDIAGNDAFGLNFVVTQPIWNGGRIGAQIDRAQASRDLRYAQAEETRQSVTLQVIDTFYEAYLSKRRLGVLVEGKAVLEDLVSSIERRVEQQVSPQSELTLVLARLADVERQITFAQASFAAARETFRQITGLFDYQFTDLPEYDVAKMHPNQNGVIEAATACNPITARANAERMVAAMDTKVAKRQLFPQLGAQFSANEVTGTRVGLVVSAQLDNGLSQFSVIDAARTRELEAAAQADAANLENRIRVVNDLLLNSSAEEQVPIGMRSVMAARQVTQSYRRQFMIGRRSWLEVVNAVRETLTAELGLVDAEGAAMASAARILVYSCRWTPIPGN